jgi:hypothetical protein
MKLLAITAVLSTITVAFLIIQAVKRKIGAKIQSIAIELFMISLLASMVSWLLVAIEIAAPILGLVATGERYIGQGLAITSMALILGAQAVPLILCGLNGINPGKRSRRESKLTRK